MSDPRVSVLLAVFNGEQYLATALDSVLSQDFGDFELIVVDDASTDSTPSILASRADPRVRVIRNAHNLRQTRSLNVALRAARGEYVARIDADDVFLPGKLRRQVALMDERSEVAVCGTWAYCVDSEGRRTGLFQPPTRAKDIAFHLAHGSPLCHVSVIMRRAAVLDAGGYDESFDYAADYALWSTLFARGHLLVNIPEYSVDFRVSETTFGASSLLGRAGEESARIIRDNASRIGGYDLSLAEARAIHLRVAASADLTPGDRALAYVHLRKLAASVYGRTPPAVAARMVASLAWGAARSAAPAARGASHQPLARLVRRYPTAAIGLAAGSVLRRFGGPWMHQLKQRVGSALAHARR